MEADCRHLLSVVPELETLYERRIRILRAILREEPIGRKGLAERVQMTERPLRHEIDILKAQGLVTVASNGMSLTPTGEELLARALSAVQQTEDDTTTLARELAERFNLRAVRIAKGDSEQSQGTIAEMAVLLTHYLDQVLTRGHQTIAVAGGTTMQQIVPLIHGEQLGRQRTFSVAAARGGLEEDVDVQANTLAERLAECLSGTAYVLYSPDTMTQATFQSLIGEPVIRRTLDVLNEATVVLFSVGNAMEMAARRKLPANVVHYLRDQGAIGEIFGCFFDAEGHIIYRTPRIGLHLEDLKTIPLPVLIAGGARKAAIVEAAAKVIPTQSALITDERCATMVLHGATHLK